MEHTSLKKPHLSNDVTDKVGRIQENAIVEASLEKPTRDVAMSGEYFSRDTRPVKQSESRSIFRIHLARETQRR